MKRRKTFAVDLGIFAALLFSIILGLAFSSCTVAPKPVVSHHASFDANAPNSGIISSDQYGFIVTTHFLQRHHITDTTAVGNYWRITAEQMDAAVAQDVAARQPKQ